MFERILDEKLDRMFDEKLKNLPTNDQWDKKLDQWDKKLKSLPTNEQLDKKLKNLPTNDQWDKMLDEKFEPIITKLDRLVDVAEAGNFPQTFGLRKS